MNRACLSVLCAATFMSSQLAWSQKQSERNVSGPAQWDSSKPAGKSYKKGTKKGSTQEEHPRTGQTRRLGNTGNLTKNGPDVNGKRGEQDGRQTSKSGKSGAESAPR